MSKRIWIAAVPLLAAALLAGCGHKDRGGVFAGRNAPDEFVVGRAAPLAVPPDFALVPPRPGQPRPQEADSSTQALDALFGGQRTPPSAGESALLGQAGAPATPGIRSEAGAGAGTEVVDKGSTTRDILNAPASSGPAATATTSPASPSTGASPPPR